MDTYIDINKDNVEAFFKQLLCIPDKFVHQTVSFGTTTIQFSQDIDKKELYRDLQNWMELRRHEL